MQDQVLSDGVGRDLVVAALPGVQRFIAEARSTSDVAGASGIFATLAARVAVALRDRGGQLVLPSSSFPEHGMPNRVVVLFPPGSGADAAQGTCQTVRMEWGRWLRQALKLPAEAQVPETPGFPLVQWVCVPPVAGGYPEQWRRAQRLLAARRRVRDFSWVEWRERRLCSLGPRWPAQEGLPPGRPLHEKPPPGLPPHEQAALSAVGWVKRRWRHIHGLEGFPSTASIASAPFRREILEHLADEQIRKALNDLKNAADRVGAAAPGMGKAEAPVPGLPDPGSKLGSWLVTSGGPWVYPGQWRLESLAREATVDAGAISQAADDGHAAARRLLDRMKELGVPAVADYLAVMVQDLDNMGRFLGGEAANAAGEFIDLTPGAHEEVSAALQGLAVAQREALQSIDLLGVPVYAGGDDLLAFMPALTALRAARLCRDTVPSSLPTASTAVLFFHYHAGLQTAMSRARELLDQAKSQVPSKHALAVGYLRRSGVSEASVQPWANGSSAEQFEIFIGEPGQRLSPRLVADLDRDAAELARLSTASQDMYRAELARLVRRHTEGHGSSAQHRAASAAEALDWLGGKEAAQRAPHEIPGARPQLAARVGVFLRQEAR